MVLRAPPGSWSALGGYFVRETVANLWIHRVASGLTLVIVAVGALIFESFALLSQNVTRIVERGGSRLFIELYIKEGIPESRQQEMLSELRRLPEVQAARWITKQQALEGFRTEGYGPLLEGIEGNPLPASLVLELDPTLDATAARALAQRLAKAPEVGEWSDSGELAERLRGVMTILRALVLVVGLCLGLMLGFLIAGTVRLALDSRRSEMDILELVGATSAFVRLPFILEGMVLGTIGGLVSVGILAVLFRLLVASLDLGDTMLLGESLTFFDAQSLVLCCVVTAVLGCVAGILATGRLGRADS